MRWKVKLTQGSNIETIDTNSKLNLFSVVSSAVRAVPKRNVFCAIWKHVRLRGLLLMRSHTMSWPAEIYFFCVENLHGGNLRPQSRLRDANNPRFPILVQI